jgi:beta-lactamase class A
VKNHQGGWGIYVKDLQTGAVASINASKPMTSASLYKLFVAERTLAMVDAGQWKLTDGAGGGSGRNLEACLKVMVNISDNTCGRALGSKLGWGKQDKALQLEGYTDTTLVTPQQTSARDVARLLERLQAGSLLSAKSSNLFMSYLKDQKVNNRLPVGLPAGTMIAHKTGDLDGYVHDAGIVYGPKTDYLVVVMSGAWQRPATAAGAHAELSKQLWQYFNQ